MAEKIIDVMQAICENPKGLHELTNVGSEYYFRFKGHAMSLLHRTREMEGWGPYSLYIYPRFDGDLGALARELEHTSPDDVGITVAYFHSHDLDENPVFSKLYRLLKQTYLKLDEIFDDILGDNLPPGSA